MNEINKITIIFLIELIRSISGFPDYIALLSLYIIFTLIENKNFLYFYFFTVFFLLRFILNYELNNFNFLLSCLILLIPNNKGPNFKYVNYSIISYIIIPIIFKFGVKIRQTGFEIYTFMESTNSFLLFNYLAFFIYSQKKNIKKFFNFLIIILNQSKLSISLVLTFFKSWKSIILVSGTVFLTFFYFFSYLFPRLDFFVKNRGIVYTLFSGRFERLVEAFDFNKISILGSLGGIENFEIEPINILFHLGLLNFILISRLFYIKLKNSRLSFKSKFLLIIPLILTGHIMENPLIVLLFHFVTENNEK